VPTTNARAPAPVEHRAIARSFLDRDPRLTDKLLVSHLQDAVNRRIAVKK
jgi:hypothetical protein